LTTAESRRRILGAGLVVGSFALAQLGALVLPGLFGSLEGRSLDGLFALRWELPAFRSPPDDRIVHVVASDDTLVAMGSPYPTRRWYADAVRTLHAADVAVQVLDYIFVAATDPAEDAALIDAVARAGNVHLGMAVRPHGAGGTAAPWEAPAAADDAWADVHVEEDAELLSGERAITTFPALAAASAGLGALNVLPDGDGVFRRIPLLLRFRGRVQPSIGLRVACAFLGVPPDRVRVEPGRSITLRGARWPGLAGTRDVRIPIDREARMIVSYPGPWGTLRQIDLFDVLRVKGDAFGRDLLREDLQGTIVVLFDGYSGAGDVGAVPLDRDYPRAGIHASVIHSILNESFLREASRPARVALEVAVLAIALALTLQRASRWFSFGVPALMLALALLAAGAFLLDGLIVPVARPLLFCGLAFSTVVVARYLWEERDRLVLRTTFDAYFPPRVVQRIVDDPASLTTAGQSKEVTILFSDIRNFTWHTAAMDPRDVQATLNVYFQEMTEIVFRHEGTIDKFIGDGLMVFFGDPEPQPDHALRAVRAAIEMQQRVREMGRAGVWKGSFPVRIRIGIHTGSVVVGNMGSQRRLSYTVIGAPVNLASRLEGHAPVGGIVLSAATRERVKQEVPTRRGGFAQAKGFQDPVEVFEVILEDSPAEGIPPEVGSPESPVPPSATSAEG
jgi:adenylate cyclase